MISVAQILSLDGADSRAPLLTDLPPESWAGLHNQDQPNWKRPYSSHHVDSAAADQLNENIIIITKKKYPFPHRQNLTIGLLERRGLCRSNIGPPAIESTNESARHCALPPRAPIAIAPLKILKMGDILEPGIWEEKEGSRRGPIYNTRIWLTDLLRPAILTRGRGGKQQSRRTAYLDGLRGFAAFLVYWHHHQLWPRQKYMIMGADYIFENSWGSWFSWSSSLRLFRGSSCKLPCLFFVPSGTVV